MCLVASLLWSPEDLCFFLPLRLIPTMRKTGMIEQVRQGEKGLGFCLWSAGCRLKATLGKSQRMFTWFSAFFRWTKFVFALRLRDTPRVSEGYV